MANEYPDEFIPDFEHDDEDEYASTDASPVDDGVIVRVYFPRPTAPEREEEDEDERELEPEQPPEPAPQRHIPEPEPAPSPPVFSFDEPVEHVERPTPPPSIFSPDYSPPPPPPPDAEHWRPPRSQTLLPALEDDDYGVVLEPTQPFSSLDDRIESEAPPEDKRPPFALWISVLIIILLIGSAAIVIIVASDILPEDTIREYLPFVPGREVPTGAVSLQGTQDAATENAAPTFTPVESGASEAEATDQEDAAAATFAAANALGGEEASTPDPAAATEEPEVTDTSPPPTAAPEPTQMETVIRQGGTEMVLVPGGTFEMGGSVAGAAHEVTLDAFYIDRYEVTNALWEACVLEGACLPPTPSEELLGSEYYGLQEFANFPVVGINWQNANAYCRWRGTQLPTEAQWEMAARWSPETDTATIYPWGNDWAPQRANTCDENCPLNGNDEVDDGWAQMAPVDAFPEGASAVGALNMAGNVAEWVADWYSEDYYEEAPETNPTGPTEGEDRVVRGGAWSLSGDQQFDMRLRFHFDPEMAGAGIGLRCAAPVDWITP